MRAIGGCARPVVPGVRAASTWALDGAPACSSRLWLLAPFSPARAADGWAGGLRRLWTAGWQMRPFEAAGDAPSANPAWRAIGLPDANPWALAGPACRPELAAHRRGGAALAGAMAFVQDDSHRGMGPWLQCIGLDESITAAVCSTGSRLFPRGPATLPALACTRLPRPA